MLVLLDRGESLGPTIAPVTTPMLERTLGGGGVSAQRDEAFADAFAEIRAEYALELPGEIEALVAAIKRARREESRAQGAAEARMIAHKLCGTGGSYGFTEISEAACQLEVALKAIEADASPMAQAWLEIEGTLQRITTALARLAP
jgi:chemotaxis protein histidine kinase CheA